MVAVAAFNATFIALANIYTDEYSTRQDANVYSNGVMQVNIFLSVNYREDITGIESQIIEYVQNNSVIYVLETDSPLTWVNSTKSNEYYHNIDSESQEKKDPHSKSDIRVPLYFTVPIDSEGTYRWVAKLGDQETNTKTPVIVNVYEYYVTPSDFVIDDLTANVSATLRVLRYQHGSFEDKQKLIRCLEYKGIIFTSANSYMSMTSKKGHKAGFFLTEKNSVAKVAQNGHEYDSGDWHAQGMDEFDPKTTIYTSDYGWEDSQKIPVSDIQDAWNKGIPMMKIGDESLMVFLSYPHAPYEFNCELQGFLLEDNFGNRVEVDMNWDVNDWWGNWAVSEATVKYP